MIPRFPIIGIWGGCRRVYAAFKFFLYTLTGSVLMLLAILAMYYDAGTTDIPTLLAHHFPAGLQTWLWLAFFASFAVKVPLWPVRSEEHTSELQSLMRLSYAVFCLKTNNLHIHIH